MKRKIQNVAVGLAVILAAMFAAPAAAQARPLCGSGYVCLYDSLDGSTLMAKLYWSNWAQSLCYNMGRYGGRVSYIVNDSAHNFVVSKNTSCSGATAPVYAFSYGSMSRDWDNAIWGSFRVD